MTREERIQANECTVARTNIYFDALYKTNKGLDEIDELIKRNEQLKADLLVSDSDSDFNPDDLDLELFSNIPVICSYFSIDVYIYSSPKLYIYFCGCYCYTEKNKNNSTQLFNTFIHNNKQYRFHTHIERST